MESKKNAQVAESFEREWNGSAHRTVLILGGTDTRRFGTRGNRSGTRGRRRRNGNKVKERVGGDSDRADLECYKKSSVILT